MVKIKLLVIISLAYILAGLFCCLIPQKAIAADQPDFTMLVGGWVRPDGVFIIRLRGIKPDGSVDAGYFNPQKINIAKASVFEWKELRKLFIKLQDEGNPGSMYTLYYYAGKDALAGFYYQAAINETFEMVFMRK